VGRLCVNALAGENFGGRDTAYILSKAKQKPPAGVDRGRGEMYIGVGYRYMIHKNKLRALCVAFAVFVFCVAFAVFNRDSLYNFFAVSSLSADGRVWVALARCAVILAVCDLCAALIYIHHAVIKRRPL
jgi:hypothetical protein